MTGAGLGSRGLSVGVRMRPLASAVNGNGSGTADEYEVWEHPARHVGFYHYGSLVSCPVS
jgi:hypothetical protein